MLRLNVSQECHSVCSCILNARVLWQINSLVLLICPDKAAPISPRNFEKTFLSWGLDRRKRLHLFPFNFFFFFLVSSSFLLLWSSLCVCVCCFFCVGGISSSSYLRLHLRPPPYAPPPPSFSSPTLPSPPLLPPPPPFSYSPLPPSSRKMFNSLCGPDAEC